MDYLSFVLSTALFAIAAEQCCGYRVCGDDYRTEAADQAADLILKRLLALRNTDWNWQAIETTMIIQVAAPERFIGREKTVEVIKRKIAKEASNMTLGQLAFHTMAVKGLCHNNRNFSGLDLVRMVKQRLSKQFGYQVRIPKEGYTAYGSGLAALCVSNYPVGKYLVNKLLASQNSDGSFGTSSSSIIAITSLLLPPLNCLTRESHPEYRVVSLDDAISKMRKFLISKVHKNFKNATYVGNSYTSAFALLGLRVSQEQGESPKYWKCREVMDSLGLFPGPNDSERYLGLHLLRIIGHTYIYLKDPEWKCIEPGPVPPGYQPTCRPEIPATCRVPVEPKHKGK